MASAKQLETVEIADEQLANTVVEDSAGLGVRRFFTIPGRDPFDEVDWETRDALIPGKDGPAFEQKNVEFPKFWSQTATNIVAQKYFRGSGHAARRCLRRVLLDRRAGLRFGLRHDRGARPRIDPRGTGLRAGRPCGRLGRRLLGRYPAARG